MISVTFLSGKNKEVNSIRKISRSCGGCETAAVVRVCKLEVLKKIKSIRTDLRSNSSDPKKASTSNREKFSTYFFCYYRTVWKVKIVIIAVQVGHTVRPFI